ncbi:metal ABC transporter permease [Salisaeta longa]|uniref:metal ABC transporter permease n=1 Tax=Salisaeta longa TaxID=503170 RepID=UPI0003B71E4C|nr:metal ABC transporter permease [Salisaeta longa]
MMDVLASSFMQRALLAGLVLGALAGYYGALVVQRRMSFLGVGLSHAAFGGVALGLWLGLHPLGVAVPFAVGIALLMFGIERTERLSADTAIGVLFAVSMALGIFFLSLRPAATSDAFAYLFGSILGIQRTDLWIIGGVAALGVGSVLLWGRWAYATFDRDLAAADGLPVARDDAMLYVALAVTTVALAKLVGIVLAAAVLVIPAATARLWSTSFYGMTVGGMLIGAGGTVAGLLAAYAADLPSGAAIVGVLALLFGLALLLAPRP